MSDQVRPEWVEKAAKAMHADGCPDEECDGGDVGDYEREARNALAAVVPVIQAEAWDAGWDAAVDAANDAEERCDVAGGDFPCGECAICQPGNPYRADALDGGGDE